MFKCAYNPPECRIASTMLGVIMMLWSPVSLSDRGTLAAILGTYSAATEWFWTMFFVGAITVLGAHLPNRKLRHIGLSLGSFIWLSIFGMYLRSGRFSPLAATCIVFALASIWIMYADARRKPRG